MAPRVGSVVVSPGSDLFSRIDMLVPGFIMKHVEICRGTERFRVPKEGTVLSDLKYRWTIILNRESGEVEELGLPEEWQLLPKSGRIRKARPARISITVFGGDKPMGDVGMSELSQGKNLGEGDGKTGDQVPGTDCAAEMEQFIQEMQGHDTERSQGTGLETSERMELGHPPKSIPKHGPGFLALGKEERDWVRRVHHKMGHPDPQRFARFLKSTHATPAVVAGALDYQCDACLESQVGFQSARQDVHS